MQFCFYKLWEKSELPSVKIDSMSLMRSVCQFNLLRTKNIPVDVFLLLAFCRKKLCVACNRSVCLTGVVPWGRQKASGNLPGGSWTDATCGGPDLPFLPSWTHLPKEGHSPACSLGRHSRCCSLQTSLPLCTRIHKHTPAQTRFSVCY